MEKLILYTLLTWYQNCLPQAYLFFLLLCYSRESCIFDFQWTGLSKYGLLKQAILQHLFQQVSGRKSNHSFLCLINCPSVCLTTVHLVRKVLVQIFNLFEIVLNFYQESFGFHDSMFWFQNTRYHLLPWDDLAWVYYSCLERKLFASYDLATYFLPFPSFTKDAEIDKWKTQI